MCVRLRRVTLRDVALLVVLDGEPLRAERRAQGVAGGGDRFIAPAQAAQSRYALPAGRVPQRL